MEAQDTRKLPPVVQNYLRQRALYLCSQGESFVSIGASLGVHRNTVSQWWKEYQESEGRIVAQTPRGRKEGQGKRLNDEHCQTLKTWLTETYPEAHGIDSALWTRKALQQLIEQTYGILIPLRTLSDYLHEWGFSSQKPLRQAYQQSPEAVEQWLNTEYPAIEAQAKQENAEIHWGDQAGLATQDIGGRGFAPKGKTPVLRTKRHRGRVNYMATVSAQGTVRFKLYTGKFDSDLMISFLKRLIPGSQQKIFLILDRHPVHRSTAVQDWLEAHRESIQVFWLPPYSPELNPAEYLNCDVKGAIHQQPPTLNLKALAQRVLKHLRKLQKLPARTRSYFQHRSIAYASIS